MGASDDQGRACGRVFGRRNESTLTVMSTPPDGHAPVVTLAALYGADDAGIGAHVAARLGVPFLDRAIPAGAALREGPPDEPMVDVERARTGLDRVLAGLGRLSTVTGEAGGTHERLDADERAVRGRTEEFLADSCRSGGVALGRGGMVVLRTIPWALHVHLGGPQESRIAQAMARDGMDRAAAAVRLRVEDRARISYVRRAYGVDGNDPAWYHLMLDGTVLDLATCVEIIVAAALARTRDPRPSPPM